MRINIFNNSFSFINSEFNLEGFNKKVLKDGLIKGESNKENLTIFYGPWPNYPFSKSYPVYLVRLDRVVVEKRDERVIIKLSFFKFFLTILVVGLVFSILLNLPSGELKLFNSFKNLLLITTLIYVPNYIVGVLQFKSVLKEFKGVPSQGL